LIKRLKLWVGSAPIGYLADVSLARVADLAACMICCVVLFSFGLRGRPEDYSVHTGAVPANGLNKVTTGRRRPTCDPILAPSRSPQLHSTEYTLYSPENWAAWPSAFSLQTSARMHICSAALYFTDWLFCLIHGKDCVRIDMRVRYFVGIEL
jgi:hypothetical protein